MKRTFEIRAVWDEEAQVYYAETDIEGLHVEAATLQEFEEIVRDEAVELIMNNHVSPEELVSRPIRDLVPAILWQLPSKAATAR
jgi:hypothetical protein